MKIVNYSALNQKNKARVDAIVSYYDERPEFAHHTTTTTHCTKYVRSMVTVINPAKEISMLEGGRVVVTKIALAK